MKKRMNSMKKNTWKKTTRRLGAMALTMGFLLTGCGSGNGTGTETPTTTNQETPTTSNGETPTTARNNSTVKPDKLKLNAENLSANVQKIDIPVTPMSSANGSALSKSGFLMLQKTMEITKDDKANYLISPISLQTALGMTVSGSDEGSKTREELMNLLLPGVNADPTVLNKEMASFAKRMTEDQSVSWNVANSIWVKNDGRAKLRDSFVGDMTNYYQAELFSAPFDQTTVDDINAWVNANTRERIPEIIDELDGDTLLALVNAMAFDGEWRVQYEEGDIREEQEFTNADGSKSKVTLLSSEEDSVIRLADGVGFVKPYKGWQYAFVALLPPEGMSTADYITKITKDKTSFAEAYLNRDYGTVYVDMPEFKAEFGATMDDILAALGVNAAYSDNAEFRAMLTDDSEPVKIGTVIHKAMIEVDRKGTKAAAATIVEMDSESAMELPEEPTYIRLDRPFVYAIVDTETGVPVFLGAQNTME